MPRRSQPGGWNDWAWLTGGCLSFTLPARGLIPPQQPCRFPCSRPLTGSRKRPGLSVSCPGSGGPSNDTNCSLLTAEEKTKQNNKLFGYLYSIFELLSSPRRHLESHWLVDGCVVTMAMWSGSLTRQLNILCCGDCMKLLWLTSSVFVSSSLQVRGAPVAYPTLYPTASGHWIP